VYVEIYIERGGHGGANQSHTQSSGSPLPKNLRLRFEPRDPTPNQRTAKEQVEYKPKQMKISRHGNGDYAGSAQFARLFWIKQNRSAL
jgi:hypothetical protein